MQIETTLGYHGTTEDRAENILTEGFKTSLNNYDWIGNGVYFFERAHVLAGEWADKHYPEQRNSVIEARIDLIDVLELSDTPGALLVSDAYNQYYTRHGKDGMKALNQTAGARRADCAIINRLCIEAEENGQTVRVVRCPFQEGEPAWKDPEGELQPSAIYVGGHVQLAVRDPDLIKNLQILDPR